MLSRCATNDYFRFSVSDGIHPISDTASHENVDQRTVGWHGKNRTLLREDRQPPPRITTRAVLVRRGVRYGRVSIVRSRVRL